MPTFQVSVELTSAVKYFTFSHRFYFEIFFKIFKSSNFADHTRNVASGASLFFSKGLKRKTINYLQISLSARHLQTYSTRHTLMFHLMTARYTLCYIHVERTRISHTEMRNGRSCSRKR